MPTDREYNEQFKPDPDNQKAAQLIQDQNLRGIQSVLQERGSRYGRFEDNASLSQELKSAICRVLDNPTLVRRDQFKPIHREAIQMILHKISRIACGDPNYDDSWTDIAGYAQLVVDFIRSQKK